LLLDAVKNCPVLSDATPVQFPETPNAAEKNEIKRPSVIRERDMLILFSKVFLREVDAPHS
jgi:hypothetical protein